MPKRTYHPKCFIAAGEKPETILSNLLSKKFDIYMLDDNKKSIHKLQKPDQWKLYMGELDYRNILVINRGNRINMESIAATHEATYSPGKNGLFSILKKKH